MNDDTENSKKPVEASDQNGRSRVCCYHQIYRQSDLKRAIQELKGVSGALSTGSTGGDDWPAERDPASLTSEDTNRLRVLDSIAADPRGHRRLSIIGSKEMVQRIKALSASMPHFASAIDVVSRAALVSARTTTALRVPPILLLGQPGIGKSYTLRCLANAIGVDFALIAANITDPFRLRGLNTAWRGARMGRVAEILLHASTTPIVLVDEFDKAVGDRIERPFDVWHSLLEAENAEHFKDDFLEIELRADRIIWFASANDLSPFPDSILDRLLVLEIPAPDREQLRIIIASIYAACRNTYGGALPEHLSEEVLTELARHNPRRITRLLDLAVGYAAISGRWHVLADDIRCADRLVGANRSRTMSFRGPVGFLQGRPS